MGKSEARTSASKQAEDHNIEVSECALKRVKLKTEQASTRVPLEPRLAVRRRILARAYKIIEQLEVREHNPTLPPIAERDAAV